MSVVPGNKALASEYESLATDIENWFTDGCSGCSFGDADQEKGWGGSLIPVVSQGDDFLASQMNAEVDRCNIGINITDATSASLSQIVASNDVVSTNYNPIELASNDILVNKNDINVAETSIIAGTTDDATSVWAATIDNIVRYTFSSLNEARYFFNSGGAVVLSLALTGGTTGNALNWATLFSTMGTITFNYNNTTQSGSGGTPHNLGYYDSTSSWQTIFSQAGSGAYSSNILRIQMRRSASGNYIELKTLLNDAHVGSVDGKTTETFQHRKLDNQASGAATLAITAPAVAMRETFE